MLKVNHLLLIMIYLTILYNRDLCLYRVSVFAGNADVALQKYSDVMELALYNGVLGGMQLDGKRFFYVNPLEVNPEISGKLFGFKHVLPERPGWYQCACCPPNVARLLASLGKYQWGEGENTIYSHLFIGGTAELDLQQLLQNLSFHGKERFTLLNRRKNPEFSLAIRIPSYAKR